MVPNHKHIPQWLYNSGVFDLRTEDGQAAFTDCVVTSLHALDERWGHLKKQSGQSQIHGHGEDAALYLADEPGQSTAVDFIGGAGGPNPQPGWIVDVPRYSREDWRDPFDHGFDEPPPHPPTTIPSYEALGGDEGGKKVTRLMESDYKSAGKPGLDGDSGAWQWRTAYDFLSGICKTVEESIAKHQPEWRASLNQERVSQGKPPIAW